MGSLRLEKAGKEELSFIRQLYKEAFPAVERKPFSLLVKRQRLKRVEILSIFSLQESRPVGLAISAFFGDLVLLDYFAMDPTLRGRGMGGEALELLRQRYQGKRFFLEIEPPDPQAENSRQRVRRKEFYLRHGFQDAGLQAVVAGAALDSMTDHCSLTFEEYTGLYRHAFGSKTLSRLEISLRNPQKEAASSGEIRNNGEDPGKEEQIGE